jgi:hypothetical protein
VDCRERVESGASRICMAGYGCQGWGFAWLTGARGLQHYPGQTRRRGLSERAWDLDRGSDEDWTGTAAGFRSAGGSAIHTHTTSQQAKPGEARPPLRRMDNRPHRSGSLQARMGPQTTMRCQGGQHAAQPDPGRCTVWRSLLACGTAWTTSGGAIACTGPE